MRVRMFLAAASALALSCGGGARSGVAAPVVALNTFSSTGGYFGCFMSDGGYQTCVAAYRSGTSDVATVFGEDADGVYQEAIATTGALSIAEGVVAVDVTLPRTGQIKISARSHRTVAAAGSVECLEYSMKFETRSDGSSAVGTSLVETASIDAISVAPLICNTLFFDSNSGLFGAVR